MKTTKRTLPAALAVRAEPAAEGDAALGMRIAGEAVVFGQQAYVGDSFSGIDYEVIDAGAFDEVLADAALDVRLLYGHESTRLLGRSTSGTLRLVKTATGLSFEADLPDTSDGRDVYELIRRGDLTGCSFGFIPGEFEHLEDETGADVTVHTRIAEIWELTLTCFPVYQGTSVKLRSVNRESLTPKSDEAEIDREAAMRRSRIVRVRAAASRSPKGK